MMKFSPCPLIGVLCLSLMLTVQADEETKFKEAYEFALPYSGPNVAGVDCATLDRKVMCGYQGWFTCPEDGAMLGWQHYAGQRGKFEPGNCSIELWPEVTDLPAAARFATKFTDTSGQPMEVFSSHHPATAEVHFNWMKDYGIDGVFVQRFASLTSYGRGSYRDLRHSTKVLANCRAAANASGRAYALMYDITGLTSANFERVLRDWKELRTRMKLGVDPQDKAYLKHNGKPVVGVWGIGFQSDHHPLDLKLQGDFLRLLKHNPEWGGCSLVVGVPTHWRKLTGDSVADPALHDILKLADVISPWTVGRYRNPAEVERHAEQLWRPDRVWCDERKLNYMPVVFPGFGWRNLASVDPAASARADASIPRLGGKFLWKQFLETKAIGARMVYVAMFDEIDEGTAIFKCTNTPPKQEPPFLTYEGLPSDHYLWLTGQGAKLLREEIPTR